MLKCEQCDRAIRGLTDRTPRAGQTARRFCSQACRQAAYEERIGKRVVQTPRPCALCRTRFTPDRSTARFCSAACRVESAARARRAPARPLSRPKPGSRSRKAVGRRGQPASPARRRSPARPARKGR